MANASDLLRLFVALVPSEASREALAREGERLARLDRVVRAVREENLHVTIAFLGATPSSEVGAIEGALRAVAARNAPVSARWSRLGAFPSADRPRVVWAGVAAEEGGDAMSALADDMASALEAVGHRVDARERFHAHVTLARVDGRPRDDGLRNSLTRGTLQGTYFPEVLSDLLLMVSENDGRGTRYRPLAVFPMGPSNGASLGR